MSRPRNARRNAPASETQDARASREKPFVVVGTLGPLDLGETFTIQLRSGPELGRIEFVRPARVGFASERDEVFLLLHRKDGAPWILQVSRGDLERFGEQAFLKRLASVAEAKEFITTHPFDPRALEARYRKGVRERHAAKVEKRKARMPPVPEDALTAFIPDADPEGEFADPEAGEP